MADFSTHPKPALDWFWALVGVYGVGLGGALFFFGRRGMVGWGLLSMVGLTVRRGVVAFIGGPPARRAGRGDDPRGRACDRSTSATARRPTPTSTSRCWPDATGSSASCCRPKTSAAGCTSRSPARATSRTRAGRSASAKAHSRRSTELPLKQGQLATAQIDGQLKEAPGVQADLLVDHGALTGMVTNRTGGRLSDAYIVVDGDFRPLGSLGSDQSSQIDFLLPPQAAAGNLAATAIADKLTPPGSSGRAGRLGAPRLARIAVLGALPVCAHGAARADAGRLARARAQSDHRRPTSA